MKGDRVHLLLFYEYLLPHACLLISVNLLCGEVFDKMFELQSLLRREPSKLNSHTFHNQRTEWRILDGCVINREKGQTAQVKVLVYEQDIHFTEFR